jgi:hypothetical protein
MTSWGRIFLLCSSFFVPVSVSWWLFLDAVPKVGAPNSVLAVCKTHTDSKPTLKTSDQNDHSSSPSLLLGTTIALVARLQHVRG